MFGIEKEKKEKAPAFLFDLEKELENSDKRKEYVERISKRIVTIKNKLHTGSKKEVFDKLGILLNGYHALTVVLARATKK